MMFDELGRLRIKTDSESERVQKINLENVSDGLIYTLGCKNEGGIAVFYLFNGGTLKLLNGKYYIRNDTTGLYHEIICRNEGGIAVLSLGNGVTL